MSKSICLLCHNTECDNSQQFKEDRQVCSAFKHKKVIDWEQRRFEIAKDILAELVTQPHNMRQNREDIAISYADSLIELLKSKAYESPRAIYPGIQKH